MRKVALAVWVSSIPEVGFLPTSILPDGVVATLESSAVYTIRWPIARPLLTYRGHGDIQLSELHSTESRIPSRTMKPPKAIGYCAITTLLALYIVGLVSNGVLRHIVQTLPLWFPIVLGLRRRENPGLRRSVRSRRTFPGT